MSSAPKNKLIKETLFSPHSPKTSNCQEYKLLRQIKINGAILYPLDSGRDYLDRATGISIHIIFLLWETLIPCMWVAITELSTECINEETAYFLLIYHHFGIPQYYRHYYSPLRRLGCNTWFTVCPSWINDLVKRSIKNST